MSEPTEAPLMNAAAAYDLLRLAYMTLGSHGIIDYMVDRGVVFSQRQTAGTHWALTTGEHVA